MVVGHINRVEIAGTLVAFKTSGDASSDMRRPPAGPQPFFQWRRAGPSLQSPVLAGWAR
ncbi:MAG: hypothetical protein HY719_07030 [Planctomycetes bacterium]|nr:hypothetical protein [Planctomycetota bacterium]